MNAQIMQARNVVFDVGRVLLSFEPDVFLPLMLPGIANERFNRSHLFDHPKWICLDEGTLTEEQIAHLACERAGDESLYDAALYAIWHFYQYMEKLPACDLIPQLRAAGKKVFVLSNYGTRVFQQARDRFQDVFDQMDGMVISADEGLIKPDPRIYQLLLDRYGLKAEETIFIDDRLENVEGAKRVGMMGLHYTGPEALY